MPDKNWRKSIKLSLKKIHLQFLKISQYNTLTKILKYKTILLVLFSQGTPNLAPKYRLQTLAEFLCLGTTDSLR
jgi:hypothetical protein